MQPEQSLHSDGLRESAPLSRRTLAAREALRRVTVELLQSHTQPPYPSPQPYPVSGNISNDGDTTEPTPTQASNQNITEQKTRLLGAIQPILEVVTDSALCHGASHNVQL